MVAFVKLSADEAKKNKKKLIRLESNIVFVPYLNKICHDLTQHPYPSPMGQKDAVSLLASAPLLQLDDCAHS